MIAPPRGLAELRDLFGEIEVVGEQVVAPPKWEARHIVRVEILGRSFRVHELIVEPLHAAAAAYLATGNPWRPSTIGGWAPRIKRGGSTLSVHSWGAAIDVDADAHPFLSGCPSGDPRRYRPKMPAAFVEAMRAAGFQWGGGWASSYDPMHFQFATGY